MTCRCKEPSYQQPWYCPSSPGIELTIKSILVQEMAWYCQAISWTIEDQDLWHHMASLDHNESSYLTILISFQQYKTNAVDDYHKKLYALLPRTALLTNRRRRKRLTYIEELEEHNFSVKWVVYIMGLMVQLLSNIVDKKVPAKLGLIYRWLNAKKKIKKSNSIIYTNALELHSI